MRKLKKRQNWIPVVDALRRDLADLEPDKFRRKRAQVLAGERGLPHPTHVEVDEDIDRAIETIRADIVLALRVVDRRLLGVDERDSDTVDWHFRDAISAFAVNGIRPADELEPMLEARWQDIGDGRSIVAGAENGDRILTRFGMRVIELQIEQLASKAVHVLPSVLQWAEDFARLDRPAEHPQTGDLTPCSISVARTRLDDLFETEMASWRCRQTMFERGLVKRTVDQIVAQLPERYRLEWQADCDQTLQTIDAVDAKLREAEPFVLRPKIRKRVREFAEFARWKALLRVARAILLKALGLAERNAENEVHDFAERVRLGIKDMDRLGEFAREYETLKTRLPLP